MYIEFEETFDSTLHSVLLFWHATELLMYRAAMEDDNGGVSRIWYPEYHQIHK